MAWCREGQAARSQCLPCWPRLPKAARKARPASASLHGKSAGQHTPPPAVLLPATPAYGHAYWYNNNNNNKNNSVMKNDSKYANNKNENNKNINNNDDDCSNIKVFQLVVLARYLLGVPKS